MLALQPHYSNYTLSSGILHKTKEVGVNGQTVIIILLSLIVAKLYPQIGYISLFICTLVILAYGIYKVFSWLLRFNAARKTIWIVFLATLAAIPVGIGYIIDIFYPSKTEAWVMVLCFYAAGGFLFAFHWCFEKINQYISRQKN
ncbi:hypothetical protein GSB16_001763 [Salmonella enterica]|uniref:Uncharacterized protein n=1 Tax=Salmonella enterica subsp. enterica serovar Gaminara TaxID=913070 RepID=A0A7Z1TIP5_SALET|nr:hypothetical protein [Salmonella enterica]EDZ6277970.1 hypothetical protein [Salmonella enterica]PVM66011.1 hypothetical protein C4784_13700 [Salmonella enterica subsp. enterica serovar Gaminara]